MPARAEISQAQRLEGTERYFRIHVQGEYHAPEEQQEAADSRERVRQNTARLRTFLPPATSPEVLGMRITPIR